MCKIPFYDLADRLYPLLSKIMPLENRMIKSAKYQKFLKTHEADYSNLDQADYVFFGDSHIRGLNVKQFFSNSDIVNYGISSDTTNGVLKRLPDSQVPKTIKQGVLFMVGYNDLKYKNVDAIINDQRNLVIMATKKLNVPISNIVLQSLFPVSKKRSYINESIVQINRAKKALCADLGCTFLDIYAHFSGLEGGLRDIYSKDGVHLNKEGYKAWAAVLKHSLKL